MSRQILFRTGRFTLHSGATSDFKIDCDALTDEDIATLAWMIASHRKFSTVEGVPTGGLRLQNALLRYSTGHDDDLLLIVDDVLSTGASMEAQRGERAAFGVVIFVRNPRRCPAWVQSMFTGPLLYNDFATITPDPRPSPRTIHGGRVR